MFFFLVFSDDKVWLWFIKDLVAKVCAPGAGLKCPPVPGKGTAAAALER